MYAIFTDNELFNFNDLPAVASGTDAIPSIVEFSTDTDATLYTVSTVEEPVDVAEQSTAILLEIRNLVLIFVLFYIIFSLYKSLKNTISNFFGR